MSDELISQALSNDDDWDTQEEYEEITSAEVDRVVAALEQLIDSTDSENIKAYLEDAASAIFALVYEDEADESRAA